MAKTFEDALNMCDVEIKERFYYLDDLLNDLEEEIWEISKEIIYAEVDEEVAENLLKDNFEFAREELLNANKRRVRLMKRLEYLESKYDIVEDLYEEMLFNILANIRK